MTRRKLPWLKRFDDENVQRIARQEQEKSDPAAHIRHTLEMAEEQVEPISEIKVGDTVQYLFEAEMFLTRSEAEEARMNRVDTIARRFYAELAGLVLEENFDIERMETLDDSAHAILGYILGGQQRGKRHAG